jgi:hypothetical protein
VYLANGKRNRRTGHSGPCNSPEDLVLVRVRLDTGIAKSLDRSARGLRRVLGWIRCGRVRFVFVESLEEEHGDRERLRK